MADEIMVAENTELATVDFKIPEGFICTVDLSSEEGKIAVRNIRRKTKEAVEASVKDGQIGEDDGKRLQKELEAITKKTTDKIDSLLAGKEKEILSV